MVHFNSLLIMFLALYAARSLVQLFLHRLNSSFLRREGSRVPEGFEDVVDPERLKTISAYTIDSSNFGMAATLAGQAVLLVVLLSGFLPWLSRVIQEQGFGMIAGGLLFFASVSVLTGILRLPFNLYDTFVIENRYGFNTMTFKLWVADLLKGIALSTLLGGLALWILLALVVHGGGLWWVWAWVVLGLFELLLLWLFPLVIAPLFNRFDPVGDRDLTGQIKRLTEEVGLRVTGVFRMDASKRSKHTNAYFTGVGRSKRIVLFDTLLASHTVQEILAVLAHEIGHWKKRHVLKQLVLAEAISLAGFYAVGKVMGWVPLYEAFGFPEAVPYAGLYLIGTCAGLLGFFAQPLEAAISRRFEREADDFGVSLVRTADPLCHSLKRMATDNLSNLNPHPLYSWFYYSHPPLVERVSRLKKAAPASEAHP